MRFGYTSRSLSERHRAHGVGQNDQERSLELNKIFSSKVLFRDLKRKRFASAQAAGPDGVRPSELSVKELGEIARSIEEASRQRLLRPGPVRSRKIRKADQSTRELQIANFVDRIVGARLAERLARVTEPLMHDSSHGWRAKRGVWTAMATLHNAIAQGQTKFIQDDIKTMFDSADLEQVRRSIRNHLGHTATADFVVDYIRGPRVRRSRKRGVRQGCAVSPLLMNLLLTDYLDEHIAGLGSDTTYVRYGDNLAILGLEPASVRRAHSVMSTRLQEIGFSLKYGAQEVVDLAASDLQKTVLLGFELRAEENELRLTVPQAAWDDLTAKLKSTYQHRDPVGASVDITCGFASHYSPAAENGERFLERLSLFARRAGIRELDLDKVEQSLQAGRSKWLEMISRH